MTRVTELTDSSINLEKIMEQNVIFLDLAAIKELIRQTELLKPWTFPGRVCFHDCLWETHVD